MAKTPHGRSLSPGELRHVDGHLTLHSVIAIEYRRPVSSPLRAWPQCRITKLGYRPVPAVFLDPTEISLCPVSTSLQARKWSTRVQECHRPSGVIDVCSLPAEQRV
jgi:hypothetical protein